MPVGDYTVKVVSTTYTFPPGGATDETGVWLVLSYHTSGTATLGERSAGATAVTNPVIIRDDPQVYNESEGSDTTPEWDGFAAVKIFVDNQGPQTDKSVPANRKPSHVLQFSGTAPHYFCAVKVAEASEVVSL